MKVNLKMSPNLGTPVTFTDEEPIDKPRIGINYEGSKLYAPMGLGWFGEKKGLYSEIYNSHSKAIFGLNNKKETTETASLYVGNGLIKLTKDLKYDFKVYVKNTASWANGRGTLVLTTREAIEQAVELPVGSRVTFWYDDGYAGYFDVDGEPKEFTIAEYENISVQHSSGPVRETFYNTYADAYKGISPVNIPFALKDGNKGFVLEPEGVQYVTDISLIEGDFKSKLQLCSAVPGDYVYRDIYDALALYGGDNAWTGTPTLRLFCPFTKKFSFLGQEYISNYGFHYIEPDMFYAGEKFNPIHEANLVKAECPFALVEMI